MPLAVVVTVRPRERMIACENDDEGEISGEAGAVLTSCSVQLFPRFSGDHFDDSHPDSGDPSEAGV